MCLSCVDRHEIKEEEVKGRRGKKEKICLYDIVMLRKKGREIIRRREDGY
jgi:hypothetical protein